MTLGEKSLIHAWKLIHTSNFVFLPGREREREREREGISCVVFFLMLEETLNQVECLPCGNCSTIRGWDSVTAAIVAAATRLAIEEEAKWVSTTIETLPPPGVVGQPMAIALTVLLCSDPWWENASNASLPLSSSAPLAVPQVNLIIRTKCHPYPLLLLSVCILGVPRTASHFGL